MASSINIVSRNGKVLPQVAVQELKSAVKGKALFKGEAADDVYRAAIDRFNKAWIDEASIIVFCESDEDVAASLKYVQKWDLEVVIACGRHSHYGASSTQGGLVIDLRKLKKVSINKEEMSITAEGGCQAIDLETPLQAEGLSVVMGAANDTGIGGLTLGGGSGFLTGQYGLVIDNLLAAKVVLADGSVVRASEQSNSDLFWAIRGGGSNFGVVTEFTYRVHKQGPVFFGVLVFTPDKIRPFLQLADGFQKTVDESGGKLAVFMAFTKAPGMPKVHPICLPFYDGPEEEARKLLAPLYALEPVVDMAGMKAYAETTMPSHEVVGPDSHQHYSTSNVPLFTPLDIDLVEEWVEDLDKFFTKYGAAVGPSKIAMEIRSYAKSASVDPSATALRARVPAIMSVIEAQHDGSVSNDIMRLEVKTMMDKLRLAVKAKHPESAGFFNLNIAAGGEKVKEIFGDNFPRLRVLKRKYDPGFVFNKWYPIPPAEA